MPTPTLAAGPWTGWMLAWLGTYLVHGTVLLGGTWAASLVVRSPGVRDALWKTALAGALATSTLSVATARGAAPEPVISRRLVVPDAPAPSALPMPPARETAVPPWAPEAALALWLAGALAGLARLEHGRRRYWRAAGARHAVADAEAAAALRRLRAVAGVDRTIYLTAAEGLQTPAAVGFAEICLPAAALAALTPAQRESVLAHELGHLVRRDPLWKVAVEIAAAVFWFQPLLRVARRQMVECAELLCDGFAVRVTGRRRPLVESLGVLAAAFRPRGVAAAGFGDHGSPLLRRAARVMDATRAPAGPLPMAVRGVLAAAALAGTLAFAPGVAPPPVMVRKLAFRALTLDRAVLDAGRTGVARVDPGGFLHLAEDRDGVRRELTVHRGADGQPAYDYRENGVPKPFDERARRWLAQSFSDARGR
ncbi:MAG TPA: M56 family metallopeptidase [Longimicrobium sp.]|nr:M56 family metallopeptidase [Longimicrobium sp.]